MDREYVQGFMDKCAELGVDPEALLEKDAQLGAALSNLGIKAMSKMPTYVLKGIGGAQQLAGGFGKGLGRGVKGDIAFIKSLLRGKGFGKSMNIGSRVAGKGLLQGGKARSVGEVAGSFAPSVGALGLLTGSAIKNIKDSKGY